jgi:undecaprenyl diphosphate synthase
MTFSKIPYHVAIIMDGNRRWAREHGLPTLAGHRKGYGNMQRIGEVCTKKGVKILTVYAFSTENWKRSKKEVNYLMGLLLKAVTQEVKRLNKENIKLQVLGRSKNLSSRLKRAIKKAMKLTENNTRGILNIALNYGGHAEIVDAVKSVLKDKIPVAKINEKLFEKYLYTSGLPPVDLLIRTGGEQRLSNFLPWQLSYTEFHFTKKYWPDFTEKDLEKAFKEFARRQRRIGR